MKTQTLIIALLLLVNVTSFSQKGSWELEKNESGIKIYTRTIEGEDIREFKAITTIEAPRKSIAEVVTNINNYTTWYPDISEARILKKISNTEYYVYNVIDLPWPATDRDGVSKMTIDIGAESTTININALANYKDKVSDYVRITKSYGFWKLTTQGTKTEVQFQYFANPGGSLPDWMINLFIVDNPYQTLQKLKEMVTK